jgi:hypothetical protein
MLQILFLIAGAMKVENLKKVKNISHSKFLFLGVYLARALYYKRFTIVMTVACSIKL